MYVDNSTNIDLYCEVFQEIASTIMKSTDDYVIIVGDLNISLCTNFPNLKLLKNLTNKLVNRIQKYANIIYQAICRKIHLWHST